MPSLLDLSRAKLPEQVAAGILLTFPKWVCAQAASKLLAELTTGRQGQTLSCPLAWIWAELPCQSPC